MNNKILADYYEERGFVNKSLRLRRKSVAVITCNDFRLLESYKNGAGRYFGYTTGIGLYYHIPDKFYGSGWYKKGDGRDFGYKKQTYKPFVPL